MRWLIGLAALVLAAAGGASVARAQSGPTAVLCAGYQHQWDAVKGGSNAAAMRRVITAISPGCGTLLRLARLRLADMERPTPPRPDSAPPAPSVPWPPPNRAFGGGYGGELENGSPRDFIVYFPYSQYVATVEAQTVVQEAAQYAAVGRSAHVNVVGHADLAEGTDATRLAEQRAKVIANLLVADGVATASLDVTWKGVAEPAVPAAAGSREPLNRRVTVTVVY